MPSAQNHGWINGMKIEAIIKPNQMSLIRLFLNHLAATSLAVHKRDAA